METISIIITNHTPTDLASEEERQRSLVLKDLLLQPLAIIIMGSYNKRRKDRDIRPENLDWEEEKVQKTLEEFMEEKNEL